MALLLKNQHRATSTTTQPVIVDQWIKVSRDGATNQNTVGVGVALPASTTGQLFRIRQGKILVKLLIGTVIGTAIQGSDPVLTVLAKQLTAGSVAVGTAVTVASTVDTSSLEVGGTILIPGTGGALVKQNAGAAVAAAGTPSAFILPQGEIYLNTTATKSGLVRWDMWYQPLDPGAYAEPAVLTAGILTVAI